MREMKAIDFVTDLLESGQLDCEKHPRVYIHTIDAEAELHRFSYSSKLNPSMDFLCYLFQVGREKASQFIDEHYEKIETNPQRTSKRNSCNTPREERYGPR